MSFGKKGRPSPPQPGSSSVFDVIYQRNQNRPPSRDLYCLHTTSGGWVQPGSGVSPVFRCAQPAPINPDGTIFNAGATKLAPRAGSCPPLISGEQSPMKVSSSSPVARRKSCSPQDWAHAGTGGMRAAAYTKLPYKWWKRNGGGRVDSLSCPSLPSDATSILPSFTPTNSPSMLHEPSAAGCMSPGAQLRLTPPHSAALRTRSPHKRRNSELQPVHLSDAVSRSPGLLNHQTPTTQLNFDEGPRSATVLYGSGGSAAGVMLLSPMCGKRPVATPYSGQRSGSQRQPDSNSLLQRRFSKPNARCGGKHAIIEAGSKSFVNSINPRCSRLGGWLAAHQGSSHKDSATSFGSMHGTFTC